MRQFVLGQLRTKSKTRAMKVRSKFIKCVVLIYFASLVI